MSNPAPTEAAPVAINSLIANALTATEALAVEAPESEAQQKKMAERKRNLERMKDEEIYMLNLSVRKGTQKKNLDIKALELELHDDLIEAILDNDAQLVIDAGRQSIIVPTFPALRAAGMKLEGERSKLQRHMMFSEPYWFVFNDKIDGVCAGFEGMKVSCKGKLDELLEPESYRESKTDYLLKLYNILVASRRVNKMTMATLLEQYAAQFPTPEQVRASFGVSCQGPIRVPSLTEQSAEDANLAEALAKQAQAGVLLQESQAKAKLQKEYVESIHKAIYEEAPRTAINNAYSVIAELMEEIGKADPAKAGYRLKNKLQKKVEELSVLVDFNTDLESLVTNVSQLTQVATSSVSAEHLQQRLAQFKADFLTDLVIDPEEGDGHRALADWVML